MPHPDPAAAWPVRLDSSGLSVIDQSGSVYLAVGVPAGSAALKGRAFGVSFEAGNAESRSRRCGLLCNLQCLPHSLCGEMAFGSTAFVFADATSSAVIAAAAAVFGGLLTAFANRGVERLRLRAGLVEKAQERRLATLEEFLLAANAWLTG